jgi:hypothetical protein
LNDTTKTPNGDIISIGNLKLGEKVLAIDRNDQIIPTEVIAILHYEKTSEGRSSNTRDPTIEISFFFSFSSSSFLYFYN